MELELGDISVSSQERLLMGIIIILFPCFSLPYNGPELFFSTLNLLATIFPEPRPMTKKSQLTRIFQSFHVMSFMWNYLRDTRQNNILVAEELITYDEEDE